MVKLTGKYAEVAMDSYEVQIQSFLSASENVKEIRLCAFRQRPKSGISHI